MSTLSRRDLLASAGALMPADRPVRRPNILFALADDWGAPTEAIGGAAVLRTPAFDRVARTGVRFTNAYVSAPSCSPSRAAMLTGQYHWRPVRPSIEDSAIEARSARNRVRAGNHELAEGGMTGVTPKQRDQRRDAVPHQAIVSHRKQQLVC